MRRPKEIERLKKTIREAQREYPGPWEAGKWDIMSAETETQKPKIVVSDYEEEIPGDPKLHIEAANPQAIGRVLEYVEYLEKRNETLRALEAAGVDNWEGFDDALEDL